MKPTREERDDLLGRMRTAIAERELTYADLSVLTGVDASQVSRICRGEFSTFADSLVRICTELGVRVRSTDPVTVRQVAGPAGDAAWTRLERSVRRVWDRTPQGADDLAQVIAAVGRMRGR